MIDATLDTITVANHFNQSPNRSEVGQSLRPMQATSMPQVLPSRSLKSTDYLPTISYRELSDYRRVFLLSISNLESTQSPAQILTTVDFLNSQLPTKEVDQTWLLFSKGLYLHNCNYNAHILSKRLLQTCLNYRLRFLRESRSYLTTSGSNFGHSTIKIIEWDQLSSEQPGRFLRNFHRIESLYTSKREFSILIDHDINKLKKVVDDGTHGFLFEEYAGLSLLHHPNVATLLTSPKPYCGTLMIYPGPMLASMKWALCELQRGKSPTCPVNYLDSINERLSVIRGPDKLDVYKVTRN